MPLDKSANLKQLATFQTVARFQNVSHAAQELHLTQSAVSIQLGSLEQAVGAPLLVRTGRGVRLTEAGETLLGYANRLLALWSESSDGMQTFLGEFSGTLRIGAVTTAEYLLPRLLVAFVNENPRVKVKMHTGNREAIVRSLAAEEIDLAIMGAPPEELKVAATKFANNPNAFLAAPSHPLMARSRVTMAMLAESPLLVRERGSGSRSTATRLFKEAGLHMRIGSELSSNEAIKQMCIAGFGLAYLSMHTCVLEIRSGLLALLPLPNNPVQRTWHVVHVPSKQLPHVAAAFRQFLVERGQREIDARIGKVEPSARGRSRAAARA